MPSINLPTVARALPWHPAYRNQRAAWRIYFLAKEIAALGGPNYIQENGSWADLIEAATPYLQLDANQIEYALTTLYAQNAMRAGASLFVEDGPQNRVINDIAGLRPGQIEVIEVALLSLLGRHSEMPQVDLSTGSVGDNGVDPILGAPYPPVNYQLFIQDLPSTQPRLYWTMPDLTLAVTATSSQQLTLVGGSGAELSLFNYGSGETNASQSGTTVTLSGGVFRFIDTASNVGQELVWAGGETAVIASVSSPTTAEMDNSQTVAAGQFSILPPNTLFHLYIRTDDPDFEANSIPGDGSEVFPNWAHAATSDSGILPRTLFYPLPPYPRFLYATFGGSVGYDYFFKVTAVAGNTVLTSTISKIVSE